MAKKQTKLELTWIGKENRPKLEPRILIQAPEKSYHATHRVSDNDIFDNMLIFGDNLLALKALEQESTGKQLVVTLLALGSAVLSQIVLPAVQFNKRTVNGPGLLSTILRGSCSSHNNGLQNCKTYHLIRF